MDAVVVGPGLGRDKAALEAAANIIKTAREIQIPLVVDADGLFLIEGNPGIYSITFILSRDTQTLS